MDSSSQGKINKNKMTKDDIIKLGDLKECFLHKKCTELEYDPIVLSALSEMKDFVSNLDNGACGLSLPQIGIVYRGYVVRMGKIVEAFINPKIEYRGFKKLDDESCLSEPGVRKNVLRNEAITVRYTNMQGEKKILKLAGLYARIVQHEQDHLDGILLVDK